MAVKLRTSTAVTVTTAGTRVPISSISILVYSVVVQSISTNTGTQYIGDDTVTAANGQAFAPDDGVEIDGPPSPRGQEQFDLSEIYVDSSTNGAQFRVVSWIRK